MAKGTKWPFFGALGPLSPGQHCPGHCPPPGPSENDPTAQSPLGRPLGIHEVALLIGCSTWTVRQRLLPAGLPHFRSTPSGRLIFYTQQVVAWITKHQGGILK